MLRGILSIQLLKPGWFGFQFTCAYADWKAKWTMQQADFNSASSADGQIENWYRWLDIGGGLS